jgi:hypothetical protein
MIKQKIEYNLKLPKKVKERKRRREEAKLRRRADIGQHVWLSKYVSRR